MVQCRCKSSRKVPKFQSFTQPPSLYQYPNLLRGRSMPLDQWSWRESQFLSKIIKKCIALNKGFPIPLGLREGFVLLGWSEGDRLLEICCAVWFDHDGVVLCVVSPCVCFVCMCVGSRLSKLLKFRWNYGLTKGTVRFTNANSFKVEAKWTILTTWRRIRTQNLANWIIAYQYTATPCPYVVAGSIKIQQDELNWKCTEQENYLRHFKYSNLFCGWLSSAL